MSTEVWLRNPNLYIRDALANGYNRFVFDRLIVSKSKQDVCSYMREMCLGVRSDVQYMLIGPQGAAHYDLFSTHQKPKAVYPVWNPTMGLGVLQDMMESPAGDEDPARFASIPEGLRPVPGQDHRVIISKPGDSREKLVQKLLADIEMLSTEYPDCKLHLFNMNDFQTMFDYGYHSVDFAPTGLGIGMASLRMWLPNGIVLHEVDKPEWPAFEEWMNLLGFQLRQLAQSRRVLVNYNIASVHWAAKYFNSQLKINMKWKPTLDEAGVPLVYFKPKQVRTTHYGRAVKAAYRLALMKESSEKGADFMLCDWCAFRATCRLVRVNSVCIYKGADTVPLADAFGSRSADRIITGLSDLLKKQADRTERAIEEEAIEGKNDNDVTKQINSLFRNGVLLAKLLDPTLNGKGTTVNVGVAVNGASAAAVAASSPRQLVSAAIAALEEQGFARADITPDMIKVMLQNPGVPIASAPPPKQIEGVIVPGPEGGP